MQINTLPRNMLNTGYFCHCQVNSSDSDKTQLPVNCMVNSSVRFNLVIADHELEQSDSNSGVRFFDRL